MKHIFRLVFFLALTNSAFSQLSAQSTIVTTDIDHLWQAYDSIQTTDDAFKQVQFINQLFIERGSAGLPKMMAARRYTAQEYVDALKQFPLFWASIRGNMLKANTYGAGIAQGIEKLKTVYPALKPANVYFTVGALKSGGTALNGDVLIGSEIAMADAQTNVSEFTTKFTHLKPFFATNPINDLVFLNVHEYVHTQQKTDGGYDLLSQSVFEGVAEFVPTVALKTDSPTPAVAFGVKNNAWVRGVFEQEMFSPWIYRWIWNSFQNEFEQRDLGYYVGYAIAKKYYDNATDKALAIKTMIEIDYNQPKQVEAFVDKTGYFSKPIKQLKKQFERSRPTVIGIKEFKNGSKKVSPGLQTITVSFSSPMDKRFRSTDFGKLGKEYFPEMVGAKFAEDGKSITYEVRLKPNQKYQFVVEQSFRTEKAIPLRSYVVQFATFAQ
jgi:hypothetical protein